MAEISNLAYVGLAASDLDAWQSFAEDILGLQTGVRTPDFLSLRMDELPYRFFLEHNDRDDLSVAGWTFDTEGELEAFVAMREKRVPQLLCRGRKRRKIAK